MNEHFDYKIPGRKDGLALNHRQWRPQLTSSESCRGFVFFFLYVLVFPFLMGGLQRLFSGTLPVAESNVVYYLLSATLILLVFWSFLKHAFYLLLDWLPENIFAFLSGLAIFFVLDFLIRRIPLPVSNPNLQTYPEQFMLAPAATVVILVVLMPFVEETLFRGLLFGAVRRYSRVLAYLLSIFVYVLYSVWQFTMTSTGPDLRYFVLFIQYIPAGIALTWCYDNGGSVWSSILLHMVIGGVTLAATI